MNEVTETAGEAKRPRKLKSSIDFENSSVNIEVLGHDSEAVDYALAELPEGMIDHLTLHGLKQKLGDAAAGKTPEEAVTDIKEVWEALKAGSFATARSGGSREFSKKGIMEKLANVSDEDRADAIKAMKKLGLDIG